MSFQVIFISGPTASGKSKVALDLAKKYRAAILNCDSIQVYKELSVGAAKPTQEEFSQAAHFLFDMISFPREYTAGDYARDFHEELECIKKKYPFAIVVGGTGFYFQAIEKGMFEAGKADEEVMVKIKRELEEKDGPENLYKELLAVDPDSAKTIHQNDYYRLQRALGIWRTKGISISDLKKQMSKLSFPYPLRKFSIHADKILLEEKILKRTQAMLKLGLISEVEELLNKGYRYWAPMKSVGYRETIDFIDGKVRTQAELKENIMISTRQLAKKQRTWFQRDTDVVWVTQENAVSLIEESIF